MDMRAKLLGHATVSQLVDFSTLPVTAPGGYLQEITAGTVKDFKTILRLHQTLTTQGFQLHQNEAFGPPGGRQLFYVQDTTRLDSSSRPVFDGILVRIKSMGNARPPRQGAPHMSISLYTGGLGWGEEKAKFDVYGQVTPKSPSKSASNTAKDVWAHACHFRFPDGFDFSGATSLAPGNYALRDAFWKAAK
jgi:hypothetical protein